MPASLKVKSLFFDRKAVIDAVGKARTGVLSKIGSFVRRTARSSMKKRKKRKGAPPGSPPDLHEGSLKRLLFFALDPKTASVVIGPVPFGSGKAPSLLEFGGSTTITFKSGKTKPAVYHAFPFMGPALTENLKHLPQHWANSIKGN